MALSSWLRNWKGSIEQRSARSLSQKPRPTARRLAIRPSLESLEDRTVPALMQVASISPASTGIITLPSPTVQVTFTQAYNPASININNLTLSQGVVTGLNLTSATTVNYTLGGLTDGPLAVSLAAGAVTDTSNDPLVPYASTYEVNLGTEPLPLTAVNPGGSLVYQGTVSGLFNSRIMDIVPPETGGLYGSEKVLVHNGDLFVVSRQNNTIDRYDIATGAPLPASGQSGAVFASGNGLSDPIGIGFGPDGNLYVANTVNTVVRFDGTTGTALGTFVRAGSGGLNYATGLTFGPDGNLYVSSRNSSQVMRYRGTTGAPLPSAGNSGAVFAQGGGLDGPDDLTFGPDGRLYVSSQFNNEVIAFSATGVPAAAPFVSAGSGGVSQPLGVRFGPDGYFYVTSYQNDEVLRYQGLSGTSPGAFVDTFVPSGAAGRLSEPTGIDFGPDGKLYVTSRGTSAVLRFDGTATGTDDVDSYTINLSANQSLALQVSDSCAVAPTLTLTHGVLGAITLGPNLGTGSGLFYQPIQFKDALGNPVAGTVTITLQSPPGLTIGSYSLQATLNAQFDTGSDGSAPVQSLAPSTLDVDPAMGINRAAALGSIQKAVAPITTAAAGVTNDLRGSWVQVGTSTTWQVNTGSGVTGSLSKNVATNTFSFYGRAGDVVTPRTKGNSSGGGTLSTALLTLRDPNGVPTIGTQAPGATSDYTIANFTLATTGTYTVTVSTGKNGRGSYTLTASLVTPANPRPNTADVYSISASAGQVLGFAAAVGNLPVTQPQVQLALYAPGVDPLSGLPVATSSPSGTLDAWLNYSATTTGAYEIKVTPGSGLRASAVNYNLVAVANGSFDNTANGSFSAAQDLTGSPGAVGAIQPATSVFIPSGSGGLEASEKVLVHHGDLFVVSRQNNTIDRYDAATGAPLPASGQSGAVFASGNGLNDPIGIGFGPDGNLYVANTVNTVVRFDGTTGAALGTFVSSGSGGLNYATGLTFGPDGNLFVSSRDSSQVMRYSGTTGAPLPSAANSGAVFAQGGGLDGPDDLTFGPDGRLYVSSQFNNEVIVFNGTTGVPAPAPFITAGSGGVSLLLGVRFGPDGDFYVTSYLTDEVLRYQGPAGPQPGAFVDTFIEAGAAGLSNPTGLAFGPDGTLYTCSRSTSSVLRTQFAPQFYKVTLSAGQTATFNTLTPGDGSGLPANMLDPHIQLFDPSQTLVATGTKLADGRNETITYTAPAAGTYYIEISSLNFTQGAYVLDPVESGGEGEGDGGSTSLSDLASPAPAAEEATSSSGPFLAASFHAITAGPQPLELNIDGLVISLPDQAITPIDSIAPSSTVNSLSSGPPFWTKSSGATDPASTRLSAAPVAEAWTVAIDTLFTRADDSDGVFDVLAALRLTVD
jgi:streptogramin lyase